MSDYPDVLGYLHSKGIQTKRASQDEVSVPCFYHGQVSGERGKLYINVGNDPELSGLYHCKICGEKGNMVLLMRHFGDEPERVEKDDGRYWLRQQILSAACTYYHSNLTADHLKWLREERGLNAKTVSKHEIGWADGGLYKHLTGLGFELRDMVKTGLVALRNEEAVQPDGTLVLNGAQAKPYDFLRDCITIPYHVAGNCVSIRGKKLDGKYLTCPRQESRLFNTDVVWGSDVAVVTEGELDALVAEQMGYPAVGSPGAEMWQDKWSDYFEDMRRVYVAFDNDSAGQRGADKLREKMGRKVRSVLLPDSGDGEKNDISKWFGQMGHTAEEFSQMLSLADNVGTLLVGVDDAYEEWEYWKDKKGLLYGFEEFDSYMRPGHLPTKVWIVLAKTNSGKTLALQNFFQGIAMHPDQQDKKILYVSLEQTRGDWFERARRIWNFWNLDCPSQDVNRETLNFWRDKIRMTDVNKLTVEELYNCVEDFKDQLGQLPDLVAIDYLGYWARSFKGLNKYEQVSEAVASLKEAGKLCNVPIIAPHQVNRSQDFGKELEVDAARDSGAIEEYADEIFLLWNPDTAVGTDIEQRTGRLKLKIGKTRAGSKGRTANFQFGYLSLAFAELGDVDRVRMLADEIDYDNRDDMSHVVEKWEAAICRHRTGIKTGDITQVLLKERGL